ncbi:MAG: SLC13 family permease [Porticoccaceae bacterium]
MNLGFDAWITAGTVLLAFAVLFLTNVAADAVLLSAAIALMLFGVLTPTDMLSGFSNLGLATVGILFVVASALTRTGALVDLFNRALGHSASIPAAQARMMLPVAAISSVLNNTPVVAMMIPMITDWARKAGISVSQLMIPLSYAAIVGGVCTVIGTSTNLVVNDMLRTATGEGMELFELSWVGVPLVLITIAFVVIFTRWLLPNRNEQTAVFGDAKQYTIEMVVSPGSPLQGQTVEAAGLRKLSGVFLVEIVRDSRVIAAVSSEEILHENDRLIFAGNVDSIVDLQKIRGLDHAEDHVFKLDGDRSQRHLVEVVLGGAFPHLGVTVRESQFRKRYGAAIIAICREGERLKQRIGDIVLRKGDILLLEAPARFVESRQFDKDFLLISEVQNSRPVLHSRRYLALAILLLQVVLLALNILTLFEAACVAAMLLVGTRCISLTEARSSVDWSVLVVIGASISLGIAFQKTGLATALAHGAIALSQGSPYAALIALFVVGSFLTALVSNMAAAVLLFPVIESTANQLGVSILPFAVTLMVAASVSLATPIGYQTNLMVYGPGNYRYVDFMKIGFPLTVLLGLVTILIVPFVWPF